MKVAVVYCYPLVRPSLYFPLAQRFARTWQTFPPGTDHELHVICNGTGMLQKNRDLDPFELIPCQFHPHDNIGWDIGAYQWAAENIKCDLLVCLGAPIHFHRAGWLKRMVEAYVENGPHLYGCWAYLAPNWHVRTTVFWLHPELLRSYPDIVGSGRQSRYEFEHGNKSLTRHVLKAGLECLMVTWDKIFPFSTWKRTAPGPADSLVHDQFTFFSQQKQLRTR